MSRVILVFVTIAFVPVKEGSIHDKLRQARRYQTPSLNQEEMADLLGMSRSIISRYETDEDRVIPRDYIERVARRLQIPIAWFYDGQPGPPPVLTGTGPGKEYSRSPSFDSHRVAEPAVGRRLFGLLGTAGAASFPIESADPQPGDFVEFSEDLFRPERFAIRVIGDSMSPRLEHGDYVLVQPDSNPHTGLLAVARNAEHEYVVKVLQKSEGSRELHPLNPNYEVILPSQGWEVVGYAVGRKQERGRGRYIEEGDNAGLRP